MKKIVLQEDIKSISLNDALMSNHSPIIAYKAHNSDSYCVLASFGFESEHTKFYGFIPLSGASGNPKYIGITIEEAIEKASKSRIVYVFESQIDMLRNMYYKQF